ncbi:MAG TPA: hypothetical protein PLQ13_13035, partial [Candidatus Krumholzibacteria bacterium]|nr:hypothetical protein [Candidatus Krumholzibacteria bacterium]
MNTLPRRRSRFPTLLCGLLTATAACLAAMPAAGQVAPQPHDTAVKPPMDPERATIDFIGGTSLKAYPYAYYTPETHLAFGGGASLSWRLRELGPDQQPGSVLAAVTYTTRSQLIVALDPEFTTRDGQWLVDPYFGFKDYPDKFWGIGPEAPASAEEDFTPRILDIQLGAQKSLGGAWRAGPSYVLMKYEPGDLEQQGQLAAGTVPGAEGGISSGLGAVVAYDSRDKRFSAE